MSDRGKSAKSLQAARMISDAKQAALEIMGAEGERVARFNELRAAIDRAKAAWECGEITFEESVRQSVPRVLEMLELGYGRRDEPAWTPRYSGTGTLQ